MTSDVSYLIILFTGLLIVDYYYFFFGSIIDCWFLRLLPISLGQNFCLYWDVSLSFLLQFHLHFSLCFICSVFAAKSLTFIRLKVSPLHCGVLSELSFYSLVLIVAFCKAFLSLFTMMSFLYSASPFGIV